MFHHVHKISDICLQKKLFLFLSLWYTIDRKKGNGNPKNKTAKGKKKMKKYIITNEIMENLEEVVTVHKNIGGGAYIAIYSGTHNEVANFLKQNSIVEYGIGF